MAKKNLLCGAVLVLTGEQIDKAIRRGLVGLLPPNVKIEGIRIGPEQTSAFGKGSGLRAEVVLK